MITISLFNDCDCSVSHVDVDTDNPIDAMEEFMKTNPVLNVGDTICITESEEWK